MQNDSTSIALKNKMPVVEAKTEVLAIRDLKKCYGSIEVLHGIDLTILAGERVALMGRSGTGKSTLLNCMCGIEPFDAGEIIIAGKHLAGLSHSKLEQLRREDIGYVFQAFHLLPTLTALENVEFPGLLIDLPTVERRQRARDLLALVGMEHRHDHRPAALSGGERQRIALARSVMNRPRLILADEPTGSLDSFSGEQVLDLLEQVCVQSGAAVLLVTHDPDTTRMCNRILHMRDGRIEEASP